MQFAPPPASQTPLVANAFGYLVPGRPPQYSDSFQQIEPAKWSIDIDNSQQIRDVVVFLTQPLTVAGMGLSCYITGPPFEKWHFIGALTNECPSGVFRVRWPPDEGAPTAARLGVSIESLDLIAQQQASLPGTELVDFGKSVAKDLWNYLTSFEIMHQQGQFLLQYFDAWMKRFEEKCKRDPFWWLNRVD
ncbi:hypothetical protein GUITHDRAFT_107080 [Guillardia theta CCMP2712]|uniref:Hikeshi-like N-terminal domain-containing protein n=1 Tax=Guillardia theta (strain CCMP2712) TaxID=905079 RepID=L1JGE8_GUITC|nr:hypothetical protein GUITHDRAFT_107080 [Guillardia theta CCMP2712]EKX47170.1 hypothetical protein GUITHDRAFT_107080 [Guillardia theta CCMP2712]|eukprot:XP_005834150.1 hypothetical protein GUITHDRAFT_107080 [Guillardia theta CCMP2712]